MYTDPTPTFTAVRIAGVKAVRSHTTQTLRRCEKLSASFDYKQVACAEAAKHGRTK